jgi:hypothetical protein
MPTLEIATTYLPDPSLLPMLNNNVNLATDGKVAIIMQAPKTGIINGFRFGTGGVTTGCTVEARAETVDLSTGNPTGTLLGVDATTTVVIANSDDNVFIPFTFTAGVSVVKGDLIALLVQVTAGTPSNFNWVSGASASYSLNQSSSYLDRYTAGAWTKTASYVLYGGVMYDGDTEYTKFPFGTAGRSISVPSTSTSTNPDEISNRFKLPTNMRVQGAWFRPNAAGDFVIELQEDDGTVLASLSWDGTIRVTTAHCLSFVFDNYTNLSSDTYYRIVVRPTTTTAVSPYICTDIDRGMCPELTDWVAQMQTDGGGWSNYGGDTTKVATLGIIVDQIDLGSDPVSVSFGY